MCVIPCLRVKRHGYWCLLAGNMWDTRSLMNSNIVNGAPFTDVSTAGHMISAHKLASGIQMVPGVAVAAMANCDRSV